MDKCHPYVTKLMLHNTECYRYRSPGIRRADPEKSGSSPCDPHLIMAFRKCDNYQTNDPLICDTYMEAVKLYKLI